MKGEGEKRKTADARMRVGLGQRFFMGKYIVSVRRVIYSTNWEERLNHCYSYLVLARSDAFASLRGLPFVRCYKERKTTFCIWVVDNPVK